MTQQLHFCTFFLYYIYKKIYHALYLILFYSSFYTLMYLHFKRIGYSFKWTVKLKTNNAKNMW